MPNLCDRPEYAAAPVAKSFILYAGRGLVEAQQGRLVHLLAGNVQFVVPIYQRTYDWHKDQCKQMYDDIIRVGRDKKDNTHFIGAITYQITQEAIQDVSRYQLIDGQQRIGTLMLLLIALKHEYRNQIDTGAITKIDQLLYNHIEAEHGERYHKMKLGEEDSKEFEDLVKKCHTDKQGNIRTNFKLFCAWLSKDKNVTSFDEIWRGIQKLIIVHVAIGENDNAQLIFESMNSTGLDLSQTDLIQNYLLMSSNHNWQNAVYTKLWSPMEQIFKDDRDKFDDYLRCYLIMKLHKHVSKRSLYKEYKIYAESQEKEKLLEDLHKYAEQYAYLATPKKHESLNELIQHIRDQDTVVADPLLLKILYDYSRNTINKDDAGTLFKLIDSYLLRCTISDTAKNLNKAIPVILSKIVKSSYAQSVEYAIMSRQGKDKFPKDSVFENSFSQKEFYATDPVCLYVLRRLAKACQAESAVNADALEIEHIMPQKLSNTWGRELGSNHVEIHDANLHRIGNLTLTEDNKSLSNNSFTEKQKIYTKSIVEMTAVLNKYQKWTECEITDRSNDLAKKASKIWAYPRSYRPRAHQSDDDDNTAREQEYLDKTDVKELWHKLKLDILGRCPGATFTMMSKYATFKSKIPGSGKIALFCSIKAQKHKIHVVYNTTKEEDVIGVTSFVDDVSKIGHHGVGDYQFTVFDDDDVLAAVDLTNKVWRKKMGG